MRQPDVSVGNAGYSHRWRNAVEKKSLLSNPTFAAAGVLAALIAAMAWSAGPVSGQTGTPWPSVEVEDGWQPPRTPWGVPDLTGIWDSKSTTPLQRPEEYADREFLTDEEVASLDGERLELERSDDAQGRDVRAEHGTQQDVEGAYNNIFSTSIGQRYSLHRRTSLIIDPPSGRLPPRTAEGERRAAELAESFAARAAAQASAGVDLPYFVDLQDRYDNPEDSGNLERCVGVTLPCTGGLCGYSRMVQGPNWVGIYYEQGHGGGAFRRIPLDGRPHLPAHIRQWMGDSVGHWDGDTLVVDTTNFSDRTSYMGARENLHLIERFTLVAPDLLQYQITVEDSDVWTQPWTIELALARQDNVQNLIFESACHEGNYALTAMLAGARIDEAAGR